MQSSPPNTLRTRFVRLWNRKRMGGFGRADQCGQLRKWKEKYLFFPTQPSLKVGQISPHVIHNSSMIFFCLKHFIALETEPVVNNYKPIPVILGRLFLVTVNALINCKNGLMNLSFGNITLELNVFNICSNLMKKMRMKIVVQILMNSQAHESIVV